MRHVIALLVGLALSGVVWSTGVVQGAGDGGTQPGASASAYVHNPRVMGGTPDVPAWSPPPPPRHAPMRQDTDVSSVWVLPRCTSTGDTFCTGRDERGLWWRDRGGNVVHLAERFEGEPEEDQPGWDCRIHGNRDCG